MLRYNILLMDADDTLFDFHKAEAVSLAATLTALGIEPSDLAIRLYSKINAALWREFEQGKVTKPFLQQARFGRLFEQLGVDADTDAAKQLYVENLAECAFLLPGAEALCKRLVEMGCRLYLATNGISIVQHRRLEKSPLKAYMSDIFVSEDIGTQKPNIKYYQYIFDKISLIDKSQALMVGDSLTSDMAGGLRAGLDTCWYNPGHLAVEGVQPLYEIAALEDLFAIVEGREGNDDSKTI